MIRPRRTGTGRVGPAAWLVAAAGIVILSGCGNERVGAATDAQLAARVNKDDITVHQVQQLLQRQPRAGAEQGERAARRALDVLVEQELAAQAARAQGLEQDPAVVQAMQAARREVLARAYQDRLAAKATGPSADDVDRYYASQPDLFARRRIYLVQEFLVEAGETDRPQVEQIAREARHAKEIEERLRAVGLRFRTRQFAQAAEDMPMALLAPMSQLEPGRSLVIPQAVGVRIFSVMHAQAAPVERRLAGEAIGSYLYTERKRQTVEEGMKALRENAKIEYRGSFALVPEAPGASGTAR